MKGLLDAPSREPLEPVGTGEAGGRGAGEAGGYAFRGAIVRGGELRCCA